MTHAHRSMLWMLAFCLGWLLVEGAATLLEGHYSPFQIVWTRYAVHLAFMLGVWGWRDPVSLVRTRRLGLQLGRSLLMLVMPVAWVAALNHGDDGSLSLAVLGLSPLIVLALSRLVNGEPASQAAWIGAAVASAGALLLVRVHAAEVPLRLAAAGLSAVAFSLYLVLTRSLRFERTRANMFYTALGVFALLSWYMPRVWVTPSLHDLLVMTAIGLLGWVALWALDRMTSAAPVEAASPLLTLMPAAGLVAVPLLTGHHPATQALLGAALIGVTAVYAALRLAPIRLGSPA